MGGENSVMARLQSLERNLVRTSLGLAQALRNFYHILLAILASYFKKMALRLDQAEPNRRPCQPQARQISKRERVSHVR